MNYIRTTAARHGIDKHVKHHHKVLKMDWKSEHQYWAVDVTVNRIEQKIFYARYLVLGTGYYDYDAGLAVVIPGLKNFKGTVVHPQFWPENLDYTGKKVVIIGSGATAVTLLPAMSDKAAKVTMLQRSPGYFLNYPLVEPIDILIRKIFPTSWAHAIIRMRFLLVGFLFFQFCQFFPNAAIKGLRKRTEKELPKNIPIDPHFVPSYRPWQQRMCITPGGDFFQALRSGKGDIATDHIETVTESGIKLKSGATLDADIIVTATGLKMQLAGGASICIDGKTLDPSQKFTWKGALLQDVPNMAFIFGYTNASWTLGADTTARLFVRLIKTVKSRGMTSVAPRIDKADNVKEVPFLNLNSTYIKDASQNGVLPKGGDSGPWKPRRSYFQDYWIAKWGDLSAGLQFYHVISV